MNGKIYCITNMVNGKRYIGQTITKRRWNLHKSHANCGKNGHLYDSMRKYGIDNFRFHYLVEGIDTLEKLNCVEMYAIDLLKTMKYGYNKKEGGTNGRPSEETKLKMSLSSIDKKLSEEAKQKISKANTGRPSVRKGTSHSAESIMKMSESHKGQPAWNKGKECPYLKGHTHGFKKGMVPWNKGKSHSEETKRKISETKNGKSCNSSTKFKKGRIPWNKGLKKAA